MKSPIVAAALVAALAAPAAADTLYVSAPPPAAPGHPLRLGADHRAGQVGDLVNVAFNFAVASSSSDISKNSGSYNLGIGAGTGNAALSFLRFPTGLSGSRGTDNSKTRNGSNSFNAVMMATVTNVLPSGALAISGDQRVVVNGQKQVLHITGVIRPEDIDNTDAVLSSRVANINATFDGDFQEKNKGLVRKILDFLF